MNMYDKKIENIIKKYFESYTDIETDNPVNLIGKIINENCIGKKFAIWGAGEHTENLHKHFSEELKNCKFIIDNNKELLGKKFLGFNVVSPNDISNYDIDIILISSYAGCNSIEKQIKNLRLKCKIINFYTELEDMGVKLEGAFYSNPGIYVTLYNERYRYFNCNNEIEKEQVLSKIIFLYLAIRDFYNANIFINEYLKSNFNKKKDFLQLAIEIRNLLESLKKQLKDRMGQDIILMFFDSLRAKDVYSKATNMKFLNSILNKSTYFTKAYSPSIVTYESIPSILSGSMPFINSLYKNKNVNQEECDFINKAIKEGYKIKIYTLNHWNIIEGKNIEYGSEINYASETLWNALCDLANTNKKNTINLLYFLEETHPPHIGGKHAMYPQSHVTPFTCNDTIKQTQEEYIGQYKESLIYIDSQLEFYWDIMPESFIKVIFSDHGQIIEEALQPLEKIHSLAGWHTMRFNVPFIVNGQGIKYQKIDKIYSLRNFGEMIKQIMDDKMYIKTNEVAEVNFSKINNGIIIEKYKSKGYDDYLYGFKVFLDEEFKIIITGNEKIKVYSMKDEFKEIEDELIINKVIKRFKEKKCDFKLPKF